MQIPYPFKNDRHPCRLSLSKKLYIFLKWVFSVACYVGFTSLQSQLFVPLHLCIDSHLCRCIMQRLCVAVFMHPCIPTLFDHLYASLHRAFWHTRPASVPGVNTGTGVPATRLRATPKARMLWLLAKSYKQGRLCQLNRAVARCNGTNS